MQRRNELDKALGYIERGLKDRLILEDIAACANMSAWHFHRVFLASTGITVGEYIRKRRMSEAAKELVFTSKPIKQLAGEYQYESQAAFTRSFTCVYGISPGKLRRQVGPMHFFHPMIQSVRGEKMLKPRFETKAAFRVVGISCQNTMKQNSIPALWNDFNQRLCGKVPGAENFEHALGICFYDPEVEMNEDTPFTYMACLEYPEDLPTPEGLQSRNLSTADYAVFVHKGTLDTLSDTYDAIYSQWLPNSEYRRGNSDDLELYGKDFEYGSPDSIMEIWVPIVKA